MIDIVQQTHCALQPAHLVMQLQAKVARQAYEDAKKAVNEVVAADPNDAQTAAVLDAATVKAAKARVLSVATARHTQAAQQHYSMSQLPNAHVVSKQEGNAVARLELAKMRLEKYELVFRSFGNYSGSQGLLILDDMVLVAKTELRGGHLQLVDFRAKQSAYEAVASDSASASSLSLQVGTTSYVGVRANNPLSMVTVASSDGVTILPSLCATQDMAIQAVASHIPAWPYASGEWCGCSGSGRVPGAAYNPTTGACSCQPGFYLDGGSGRCVACAAGTCNPAMGNTLSQCPASSCGQSNATVPAPVAATPFPSS